MLSSVLHHDSQAGLANHLLRRAENPDSWIVHLDDGIDAFSRAQKDGIERLWRWHGVSVQRDYLHPVAGKGDAAVLDCAGVEEVNQQPLAFTYADRLAGSE